MSGIIGAGLGIMGTLECAVSWADMQAAWAPYLQLASEVEAVLRESP